MPKAKTSRDSKTLARTVSEPVLAVDEIIGLLKSEYGPFNWEPRLDTVAEVVFTILSQHTSDTNSERAFQRLLEEFGSLEAVAHGDLQ